MPIEQEQCCGCCNSTTQTCPECGSTHVTPREKYSPDKMTPNNVVDFGFGEDSGVTGCEYFHICWDCGWGEKVTMTVERERIN